MQRYLLRVNLEFLWESPSFTTESKIHLPQDADLSRSYVTILDRGYAIDSRIPIYQVEVYYPKYGRYKGWLPEYVVPVALVGFQVDARRPG